MIFVIVKVFPVPKLAKDSINEVSSAASTEPRLHNVAYCSSSTSFSLEHLHPLLRSLISSCHGFSRGRVIVCEDGCGLFRLGLANRGKWEYSLLVKASLCQFFCCGGKE